LIARTASAFVHAMLTQAPAGTFSGGLSLGFCPDMALPKPLCPADSDGKPAPSRRQAHGIHLALLISGDGGWAGIDEALAAEFSKRGVPVIGLDSLRYFCKKRTPESASAAVDRILRHYLSAWNKRRVLLIGFSQGADVMPFLVNRLSPATRSRWQLVALLSLSRTTVFEFHVQNWLGGSDDDVPVAPEVAKMTGVRALCVYGEEDDESMCIQPEAKALQVIKLKGGHHFDGDYSSLARLILARAR
jgi:type IV secretory pathway VirJ component